MIKSYHRFRKSINYFELKRNILDYVEKQDLSKSAQFLKKLKIEKRVSVVRGIIIIKGENIFVREYYAYQDE